ncbi:MAG: type II toxin-antitoxin system RelE/ParE family toxin [Myxococcales bacterium]|nr:MAG: type II toxin-antitoxin system RelE/ParE family toxin [Myxococcales bacterium]
MNSPSFRVFWTETAIRDLEDLLAYIAADSPANARNVLGRLKDRAVALGSTPGRGRVVPELAQFGLSAWRELIVRPYRLIYRIESKTVYVLAVLDSRRDLEDLLLKRLLRE